MKPPITVIPKPGGEERAKVTRGGSLREQLLQVHDDFMFCQSLNMLYEGEKALKGLEKQTANNLKKEKEVGEILKDKISE